LTAITLSHSSPSISVHFVSCSGANSAALHQHVDLAEAVDGGGDQRLDRGFVADVGDGAGHRIRPVLGGDLLRQFLAVGDVGDHHACALGGERPRVMPADAFRPAGDDRRAARQSRHGLTPSGSRGG
jgi:hypothetical protein